MTGYSPTTALIVVDVQNDFAHPDGSLFVTAAPRILPYINSQIDHATSAGALVVASQDWHPASTPHFAKDGGIWPVHCVADTWGADFHEDLIAPTTVVRKGTSGEDGYSAFTVRDAVSAAEAPTGLGRTLSERGVTDVYVLGLATDYCVKETAIDATRYGFSAVLLADGIAAVDIDPGDGARACASMIAAGVAIH
ncbi:MAG: isochorismatase family protein [Actinomycetia bacterium]|nr:isochorismatase family protein [Actinomycetes bacterium]